MTEKERKLLFVGGPYHGQVLPVPSDSAVVMVPIKSIGEMVNETVMLSAPDGHIYELTTVAARSSFTVPIEGIGMYDRMPSFASGTVTVMMSRVLHGYQARTHAFGEAFDIAVGNAATPEPTTSPTTARAVSSARINLLVRTAAMIKMAINEAGNDLVDGLQRAHGIVSDLIAEERAVQPFAISDEDRTKRRSGAGSA